MIRSPAHRIVLLTASLAAWAIPGSGGSQARPSPEQGWELAAELGCGGCHAGAPAPDPARAKVPLLGPEAPPLPGDFVFEYLADPQPRRDGMGATRMPDFRLDEGERVALALFLGTAPTPGSTLEQARRRHPGADAERGRWIYRALGCAGCHQGVDNALPVAGPDLSREGAAAAPGWLAEYLADPTPIRGPAHPSAPGARMPDFRLTAEEARALSAWLADQGRPFASPPPAQPLTRTERARTERFLETRVSCLGCHRIAGTGGRIGPDLGGVAARRTSTYVVEIISDPGRGAPGAPMPHQPMPAREAQRLARLLLEDDTPPAPMSEPSLANPAHPAWTALDASDGTDPAAALYARHCAACHGSAGGGDGWNAANLPVPPTAHRDARLMSTRVDDALYDGIHAGAWVLDGSNRMPAFGALLSPGEIRSLVARIRTLCACAAPGWSDAPGGGAR